MTIKPEYPVVLRPLSEADGGGWVAIVPDLPGCMSDGSNAHEALKNAEAAIEEWKAAAISTGRAIPRPDDSLGRSLDESVPAALRREAEDYARQMSGRRDGRADPGLVHAIITQWAKLAADQVRL